MRTTGLAAILAGTFFFAGQAGELVFGSPSDFVDAVFVGLVGAGLVALVVALWGIRNLLRASSRPGRIGAWLAVIGGAFLVLFAIQAAVSVARTGEIPENFILFLLGFLFLIVGQAMFTPALRRTGALGRAWFLPLIAVAGAIVAIAIELDPIHDVGLFVFEGSWVALGLTLLRAD